MSTTHVKDRGECQCGAFKIEVDGTPVRMAACHCRDCQQASGTGHMSIVFIAEENVRKSGDMKGYAATTDSGNTYTRYFCPTCGSRVYGENTLRPGIAAIPVGVFEDRSWFRPDAVVYCRNRNTWDISDTDVPNFETMPPPA